MPVNIIKEPRDKEYKKLIQYAFKRSKNFVLSIRDEILIHYPEPEILNRLETYITDKLKAHNNTQINYYDPNTMLYFYECNEDTKSIILEAVTGLYEWREPYLPEDLTFLNDKGEVWMNTISHERMAGINEIDRNEVEFIKNEIGLEIHWIEKVYTEDEVGCAMDSLFGLIEEYFYLLRSNSEGMVNKGLSNKENSPYYGFWNDYNVFSEFDISEHCLAFEIARFSNLLRLNEPIYAYDFSQLLDDKIDNSYLVQLLTRNINENHKILFEFLNNFKLKYGRVK